MNAILQIWRIRICEVSNVMSTCSKQQLFQYRAPAIMWLSSYILCQCNILCFVFFLLGLCRGYSAHLRKCFPVLRFALMSDIVFHIRFSGHLNQSLVACLMENPRLAYSRGAWIYLLWEEKWGTCFPFNAFCFLTGGMFLPDRCRHGRSFSSY